MLKKLFLRIKEKLFYFYPMRIILAVFLYFVIHISHYAQSQIDSTIISYYQVVIQRLSNDSLKGRPASSDFEKKASAFIFDQFKSSNLRTKIHLFTYRPKDSTSTYKSQNVYCYINNKADSTIIIGAHYDHIGLGGPLSRSLGKKGIHPGADDNASGIALLLSLAHRQKNWNNLEYNYILVAYSAHEIGLFGSTAFAKFVTKKYGPVALAINFDMVGRMNPDLHWLKISGVDTNTTAGNFFKIPNGNIRYKFDSDSILLDLDTREYYRRNIPCISFTTGIHDDYHKITDTENKINYWGILYIEKMIEAFLLDYPR